MKAFFSKAYRTLLLKLGAIELRGDLPLEELITAIETVVE